MGKTKSYNYNDAIRNNRFKDIERLYAKGHKFHKHNLLTTLKCNNIKMFKWFLEKGAPLQRNTFNELLYLKEWNIAKNILLGKLKYNYDNEGYVVGDGVGDDVVEDDDDDNKWRWWFWR